MTKKKALLKGAELCSVSCPGSGDRLLPMFPYSFSSQVCDQRKLLNTFVSRFPHPYEGIMMVHTSWITSLWPPSFYHMDVEMEATVQRAVELGVA